MGPLEAGQGKKKQSPIAHCFICNIVNHGKETMFTNKRHMHVDYCVTYVSRPHIIENTNAKIVTLMPSVMRLY